MGESSGRRRLWILISAGAVQLAPGVASAADPLDVQALELADGRVASPPTTAVWGRGNTPASAEVARAIDRLRDEASRAWVVWDDARDCASGVVVSGVVVPGSTRSASVAEAFAREFVERHVALFAATARASDFVVVGNDLSHDIRTIGLQQFHDGVPVLGGRISLRFANDRLTYVASSALPVPELPARVGIVDGRLLLPEWTGVDWSWHDVVRVEVRSAEPLARWAVYLDATTGDPIGREQLVHDAATIRFDVPVRYPVSRYDAIAPQLDVVQGGNDATTDLAGSVALTNSPTTIDLSVSGPLVRVVNLAGETISDSFGVANGDTLTWSVAGDEFSDAQLSAFVHLSIVKSYVRDVAPDLAFLDDVITANVNLDATCNAQSDGDQLYFRRAGDCENTARLADVVYHEYGHSVHGAAIIPGVGAQSSSLSEGISDYLAATITNDSGMGRGFVFTDDPLRELDPDGYEWSWPQDQGESHLEGRIIGGTLWDLRTALMAKLGDEEGREHADLIWYESIRRAYDIPSMYPEALVADDDDGDISNGTPNVCEINAAFEAHGLLDPDELAAPTVELEHTTDGRRVVVTQSLPVFADCPFSADAAELRWRLRDAPDPIATLPMAVEDGAWVATLPEQEPGVVVEYQVSITYSTGTTGELPRNAADPWYQTFFGGAQPIYCLDENADQSAWAFNGAGNNWSFGPLDVDGVDPGDPWDDDGVLLSQDGFYPPWSSTTATGPQIDLAGYTDVRLHHRRWLTVEDRSFDRAALRANGEIVWQNLATEQANVHHVDREWRFQDIPLTNALTSGSVTLQYTLDSDGGLELGGWTVDGLCVIQVVESFCGDYMTSGDEECDDGNLEDGDGCDATCMLEDPDPTGDDTGSDTSDDTDADTGDDDPDTTADDGASVDGTVSATSPDPTGADETSTGGVEEDDASDDGCGCTSGRGPSGLVALVGLLALRRRRRSAQDFRAR